MWKNHRTLLLTSCTIALLLTGSTTNVNAQIPSVVPSVAPSIASASPSAAPSVSATLKPSASPSIPPVPLATLEPSANPSITQTSAVTNPTQSPVEEPSDKLRSFTERTITMTLTGVEPLDDEEKNYYESQTADYIRLYYDPDTTSTTTERTRMFLRNLEITENVYDVEVFINVTSIDPPFMTDEMLDGDNDARKLQTNDEATLTIIYDQTMKYRYSGDDASASETEAKNLIQEPFSTLSKRNAYIDFLQDSSGISASNGFSGLTKVGPPELYVEPTKVGFVAIICGAAGGVVFIILVVIFICWRRRKANEKDRRDLRDYDPSRRRNVGNEGRALPVIGDEQSTLAEPTQEGVFGTQQSIIGRYGHPGSVATTDDPDYAYNHHGGYGEQSIVSNTDGTLGDATRQSTKYSAGDSILGPGGGQSIFTSDDQSFEAFRNRGTGGRKEEIIEIYAPAGKLGVVIDTPDTGAPVLHNIKDTCPIADKLRVGDKLIAVDDEDVRSMTAVKVSKLISQKSANPTRKFTIMRYV